MKEYDTLSYSLHMDCHLLYQVTQSPDYKLINQGRATDAKTFNGQCPLRDPDIEAVPNKGHREICMQDIQRENEMVLWEA